MSSIFKRKSTWYIQFWSTDFGKTQASLRTKRKATAEKLQAALDDLYLRGLYDPWSDDWQARLEAVRRPAVARKRKEARQDTPTLEEASQRFLKTKSELASSTRRMYDLVTRSFTEHVKEELRELTPGHVLAWLGACDLNLTSKHTYLRHLGVFARWCAKQEWCEDWTADVTLQRKPEKKPKAFTKEEMEKLSHEADGPMKLLVVLASQTGLRRSELARLTWEDVDLDRKVLYVRGQTKSGKERQVPLTEKVAKILDECPREDDGIFPHHVDTLTQDFLALRRDVLPHKKGYSLHSLRHTFCTHLAEAGVPVHVIKGLAGHASIDTTMRYVHSISDARGHVEGAFG
jgi:integrase